MNLFIFEYLEIFLYIFLLLIPNLIPLCSEKIGCVISILLSLLNMFYGPE